MGDNIKVCIVGAGIWGYQHARAFSGRDDVILVGIAGRTAERTQKRASEFHTKAYLDIDEMLDTEKPDLVSVCLPALETFEPTLKVMRKGYPLLVEKPLSYDLDSARVLIDEADKRDLFFAIDFEQKYSIPCTMAMERIRKGNLGKIVYTNWRFGHGWSGKMKHPYTNLIEAQCHGIDLLESMVGRITDVYSLMTDNGGRDSFSSFCIGLRYENGAIGSFLGTMDANEYNRLSQLIEIGGTDGRILIEDNVKRYSFQKTHHHTEEVWQAGFFKDEERSFNHDLDLYLEDMISAFKKGLPPPVPATEGLRALEIAYACIDSFKTGKVMKV